MAFRPQDSEHKDSGSSGKQSSKRRRDRNRPPGKMHSVPDARGGRIGRQSPPEDLESVPGTDGTMRLQKFLAMAGVDSRRNCEEYIRDGRVTVDSEVVTDPARAVNPETQDIRLDAERLRLPRFRYFLLNKPAGVLCTTRDPQGRACAVDLIPVRDQRLFTVGRLDENTEGLLLITNDGDLAQRLAHPRFEVVRRYRCHVAGIPEPETLRQLHEGMYFSEGFFRFRNVRIAQRKGRSAILVMELQEGKNREIRRLMARVGHKVLALERIAFGPLMLGNLGPGEFRELPATEVRSLQHFVEHGAQPERRGPRAQSGFGYRPGQTRRRRRGNADGKQTSAGQQAAGKHRGAKTSKSVANKGAAQKSKSGHGLKSVGRKPTASINKGRDRRREK